MADNGLEDPFPSFSDEELNNSFRVTTKGVPYRNTGETTEIPFAGVEEDVRVPDMQESDRNPGRTARGPGSIAHSTVAAWRPVASTMTDDSTLCSPI